MTGNKGLIMYGRVDNECVPLACRGIYAAGFSSTNGKTPNAKMTVPNCVSGIQIFQMPNPLNT